MRIRREFWINKKATGSEPAGRSQEPQGMKTLGQNRELPDKGDLEAVIEEKFPLDYRCVLF